MLDIARTSLSRFNIQKVAIFDNESTSTSSDWGRAIPPTVDNR
jgi:hypothetical protein